MNRGNSVPGGSSKDSASSSNGQKHTKHQANGQNQPGQGSNRSFGGSDFQSGPNAGRFPLPTNTRMAPQKTVPTAREFKPVAYLPEDANRIQQMLEKVLGPEYVSSRSGGAAGSVSYIEGWKALNLANEIFGFNGWNSELINSTVDYFDTHGNTGRYSLGLSVVVRVTIKDGTYHEDFGYGFIDNAKSKAMAFEKCKKEAFTDGIKRCLRCFGNVLGNCLYDKTITSTIQKFKGPKREYAAEDFYRDPTVLAQERLKEQSTKVNLLENSYNTNPNTNQGNPNSDGNSKVNLNYNPSLGSNLSHNIQANTNNRSALAVNGGGSGSNNQSNVSKGNIPNNANTLNNGTATDNAPQGSNAPHYRNGLPNVHNGTAGNSAGPGKATNMITTYQPTAEEMEELDASFCSDDDLMDGFDYSGEDFAEKDTAPAGTALTNQSIEVDKKPSSHIQSTQDIPSSQMMFVSARGADMLQKNPGDDLSKLPQFDPKFIAPNIKRTLDPTVSAPTRNPNATQSGSQTPKGIVGGTAVSKPAYAPNVDAPGGGTLGKRIGMPPTHRPPSKRLHRE